MYDLKVKELSFSYPKDNRLILKDVNMDVDAGEFVCLLGPSGCGKSTFLRLLAGLETATTGKIIFGDQVISGASLSKGMVFQDYGLFPWMTAGENIMLALKQKFPNQDKEKLKSLALNTLKSVGLDESVYCKLPKALSGGMKQRCAIAQAFSIDPPILLMDEPFGALDAVTRAKLQDLLLKLWSQDNQKKTVFFVTHDVDEALLLASRIIVFGQSPKGIIYEYTISKDDSSTRETQFENPKIRELRNKLILQLNKDVASHISN